MIKMREKLYRVLLVASLVSLCIYIMPLQATTVAISWLANSGTNLSGYRVHYGTSSGYYTTSMDVGMSTAIEIGDLLAGKVYYFAVTAYNQEAESDYSEEVSISIPQSKSSSSDSSASSASDDGGSGGNSSGCFIATAL